MCGITGILRFKGPPLTQKDLHSLKAMGWRLRNRGPDDEQIFVDEDKVAFLFRRLSIIDLEGGKQPMLDSTNQVALMVNGEIYNYQEIRKRYPSYPFRSQCDSEVILPLYQKKQERLVEDLNGMFAIALWDKKEEKLFLIRDHFGVKPLFYTIDKKGHLLFASEIKALLAHPDCTRKLDWNSSLMRKGMGVMDLNQPLTSGFEDIVYLPAGSMLIVDQKEKKLETKKWWKLKFQEEALTEQQAIEGYRDLLQDAVQKQLMSDVEVGMALSGGIDSVAIATFAAKFMPIKTFTVLNLSTMQHGDAEAAALAAKFLGMPNYQLYFPWQDMKVSAELYKEAIYACEMPFDGEHLLKYVLYGHIKKSFPHIKTILLGQGSDEFNGGYCHLWIKMHFPEIPESKHDWELFWSAMQRQKKMGQIYCSRKFLQDFRHFFAENYFEHFKELDPWQYYQSLYLRNIVDYNVWHEDRNTAAHQLEDRVPFLDYRLVEYTTKIPKHLRPKLFWEKRILREALKPFLPKELVERPKVPFYKGVAERYTFRTLYDMMRANNNAFINEAIFDNPYVQEVLDIPYFRNSFEKIPECPSYETLENIASLASLGLLAKWARENTEIEAVENLNLQWVDLETYGKEALAITLSTKKNITEETILAFAPKVGLFFNAKKDAFFLIKDEEILFTLEKEGMIAFIQKVDGKQTVKEILAHIPYKFSDILADLEEGVEYGVLQVLNP